MNGKGKVVLAWIIVLILIGAGVWYYLSMPSPAAAPIPVEQDGGIGGEPVQSDIVGTWRSTEDAKFTREFRADGTVVDSYEGEESATVEGKWEFVEEIPDDLPFADAEGAIIRITDEYETYYFRVNDESRYEALSLTYLSGNGVLTFERVQ